MQPWTKEFYASRYLRVLIFNKWIIDGWDEYKLWVKTNCVGMCIPNSNSCTTQSVHIKGIFLVYCNFHFLTIGHWPFVSTSLFRSAHLEVWLQALSNRFYADEAHNTFSHASDLFDPFWSRKFLENFHYVWMKLNSRVPFRPVFKHSNSLTAIQGKQK